jgi:hypothetical protein
MDARGGHENRSMRDGRRIRRRPRHGAKRMWSGAGAMPALSPRTEARPHKARLRVVARKDPEREARTW